jgi:hypothetical protein
MIIIATIDINNKDILKKSMKYHFKNQKNRKNKIIDLTIGFIAIILGGFNTYQFTFKSKYSLIYLIITIFIFIIGVYIIVRNFIYLNIFKRIILKKFPHLSEKIQCEITEDYISASVSHAKSKIEWDFFTKAIISDEMIMLYDNSNEYRILPQSCFTVDDYAELCSIVKKKIKDVTIYSS